MAEFDALKALREELAGLSDVLRTLRASENAAEIAMARAENELNAARKLRGFCEIAMKEMQQRAAELQAEREAKG